MTTLLPSPSSLCCSVAPQEDEEGNGSNATIAFFLFLPLQKKEEEGLPGSRMGPAPAPATAPLLQ